MCDSVKPEITRVRVTFSDGRIEEINFDDLKIPVIRDKISKATDEAISYLHRNGRDKYK